MTDNMKRLLEAVSKDEALKARLTLPEESSAEERKQAIRAMADELCLEICDADFADETGEMGDEELACVAGGSTGCVCFSGGSGKGGAAGGFGCDCTSFGQGGDDHGHPVTCLCAGMGGGVDNLFDLVGKVLG